MTIIFYVNIEKQFAFFDRYTMFSENFDLLYMYVIACGNNMIFVLSFTTKNM